MFTIEHCTVEEFGSGFKAVADEGYALYNQKAFLSWEEYCKMQKENSEEYPEKTLFEYISFSRKAYLPANADGSEYGIMRIEEGMRVYG